MSYYLLLIGRSADPTGGRDILLVEADTREAALLPVADLPGQGISIHHIPPDKVEEVKANMASAFAVTQLLNSTSKLPGGNHAH